MNDATDCPLHTSHQAIVAGGTAGRRGAAAAAAAAASKGGEGSSTDALLLLGAAEFAEAFAPFAEQDGPRDLARLFDEIDCAGLGPFGAQLPRSLRPPRKPRFVPPP